MSFGVVGHTKGHMKHQKPAASINIGCAGNRYIVCHQERDLSDGTSFLGLGKLIQKFIVGVSGDFDFLLYAHASDSTVDINSPLIGQAFMFRSEEFSDDRLSIKNYIKNSRKKGSLEEPFEERFKDILPCSVLKADFKLYRTGKIELKCIADIEEEKFHHSSSEAYFFIKDICHTHQHHNSRTDTITDLYECEGSLESQRVWKNETLRSMYKRVLDHKRHNTYEAYSSALGVLEYIKTFKKLFCTEKPKRFIFLEDDNLKSSIEVCKDKLSYELDERKVRINQTLTWTVFVLTAFFSYLRVISFSVSSLVEEEKLAIEWLLSASGFLANNPFVWFCVLFGVYMSIFLMPNFFQSNQIISLMKILVSMGKRKSILVLLFVLALLVYLAYILVT